ncbi:NfeD family protein [Pseudothauera lacus]|nr:nodulation protein NfeD [Pseudothauera lacus]
MRWVFSVLLVVLGGLTHLVTAKLEPLSPVVHVLPIEGDIDLGLAPFVRRVLSQAEQEGAAAVILQINTFGGRLDAAVQIRDALMDSEVRTVAFVNKRAISAGALIALASGELVMVEGGTIGAATPVHMGEFGATERLVEEKTVSYVRREFRATAEARKRPPLLAEAMVDADVEIPDVIEKGKLLTLTTEQALQQGLIDFRADSMESVLEQMGLADAERIDVSPNWAENLVRFLTRPVIGSLLMSIGMLGIIIEVRSPGFGLPGVLGLTSLGAFLWGHLLVNLAGWEELLLVGGGIVLLGIEIVLLQGFGIAGIVGITAMLAGLAMSMVGAGATASFVIASTARVLASLLAALLGSLVVLRFLPHLPFARRMVLHSDLGSGPAHGSAPEIDQRWQGKQGRVLSVLRPAGIAEIEGERVDVVSDGAQVEPGERIEVTHVDGNRVVVRRVPHHNQEQ